MPFSKRLPPKGKKIKIYKKVWEGVQNRQIPDRRTANADRRKITFPKLPLKINPDAKLIEKIVTLGRRKVILREVEERDLQPRTNTNKPTIKREWLQETAEEVQRLLDAEIGNSGAGFVLAANKLFMKSPYGYPGKVFTRVNGPNNTSIVFIGYDPIMQKFYYSSTRRIRKREQRIEKEDRRDKTDTVFEGDYPFLKT